MLACRTCFVAAKVTFDTVLVLICKAKRAAYPVVLFEILNFISSDKKLLNKTSASKLYIKREPITSFLLLLLTS